MEGSRSLGGSVVQKQTSESESLVDGRNPVEVEPHEALFLALAYLRFMDLLRIRTVCKSLRDAVDGDALLWEKVALEPPLSLKVNDLILLNLVSKSKGKLSSLVLIDCWFFTDSALHKVAKTNPNITQVQLFLICSGRHIPKPSLATLFHFILSPIDHILKSFLMHAHF